MLIPSYKPCLGRSHIGGARNRIDLPHRVLREIEALVVPEPEHEAVVIAVVRAQLKGAHVLDGWVALQLTLEQSQQEFSPLVPFKPDRLAPLITTKQRCQCCLLSGAPYEAVDECERQEDKNLAAWEREQPARQRHRRCRVSERVNEGKSWDQRLAVAGSPVEQPAERCLELPVLDDHLDVLRQLADSRDLLSEMLDASNVVLDEEKDEVDGIPAVACAVREQSVEHQQRRPGLTGGVAAGPCEPVYQE